MNLLAFDTCLDKTYIALSKNNEIVANIKIKSDEKNYHSAYLISTIAKTLKDNGLTPADLDAIAINVGPGSFTGIRACTTVARVMGQQLGIKTVGISSLEILSNALSSDDNSIIALDARKEMAYLYDKKLVGAVSLNEACEQIKEKNCQVITDNRLYDVFKELSNNVIVYTDEDCELGEALVKIALEKLKDESTKTNWNELMPLYIQPPPISVKGK